MLSGRGLCDALITRPEESYRMWRVVVCDLESSRMRPWPALCRSATGGGDSGLTRASSQLNAQIIQRLQSKILRSITNAPRYVSNCTLHNGLHIPLVATEINRLSLLYHKRLVGHHNALITAMATPPNIVRRLKRQWPTDVFHTAAGD